MGTGAHATLSRMTVDSFKQAFGKQIEEAVARVQRRYSVDDEELATAFYSSARKYSSTLVDFEADSSASSQGESAMTEFLASLNCDDLCLALACAKGDNEAWEDFIRDYRGFLSSIARTMTSDPAAADQLADSAFADLYGLRESGGARVSKFSFYSGRGSLKGWLRAVVFQLSADNHRQVSRYVQTEEPDDIERMVSVMPEKGKTNGEVSFVRDRYKTAIAESLGKAISQLESRDRLLLTYYYYDEMTLREIGKIFNVHEATISRWLVKVQKRARKLVEKSLMQDQKFNRREVTEAIELAAEQLDVEVRGFLFETAEAKPSHDRKTEGAGEAIAQN